MFELHITTRSGESWCYPIEAEEVTVGRTSANEIVLGDDDAVARCHARLHVDGGWLIVQPVTPRNVILVNGVPVQRRLLVASGDEIQIGGARLRVVHSTGASGDDPPALIETRVKPALRGEAAAQPQAKPSALPSLDAPAPRRTAGGASGPRASNRTEPLSQPSLPAPRLAASLRAAKERRAALSPAQSRAAALGQEGPGRAAQRWAWIGRITESLLADEDDTQAGAVSDTSALEAALALTPELLAADAVALFVRSRDGASLEPLVERVLAADGLRPGPSGAPRALLDRALSERRVTHALRGDPAFDGTHAGAAPLDSGLEATLAAPLLSGELAFGVLFFARRGAGRPFAADERTLAATLARLFALRLERSDLRRALRDAEDVRVRLERVQAGAVLTPLAQDARDDLQALNEMRHVSVLVADLAGFTALSERLGPKPLTRVITEFNTAMGETVAAHGGVVERFHGDLVVAIFGAPRDDARHAEHALQAAFEMRARLARLEAGARHGLQLRVGIGTGVALVGHLGPADAPTFTAVGGAADIAINVQALARKGGAILASAPTLDGARDHFDTVNLGPHRVGGRGGSLDVHEVTRATETAPNTGPLERLDLTQPVPQLAAEAIAAARRSSR